MAGLLSRSLLRPLHHSVVPLPRFAGEDRRLRIRNLNPPPFTGEGNHEVVERARLTRFAGEDQRLRIRNLNPPPFTGEGDHGVVEGARLPYEAGEGDHEVVEGARLGPRQGVS